MPYKDPEKAKQYKNEYNSRPEVKERVRKWRSNRIPDDMRVCSICGDRESREYYRSVQNPPNIPCYAIL